VGGDNANAVTVWNVLQEKPSKLLQNILIRSSQRIKKGFWKLLCQNLHPNL
jgi:hypothetical protein